MSTVKVLVLGGPGGPQGDFVAAISEVKVRSSARTPRGEGFVPMDFGRLRLDDDLDLQIFGVDRDRAAVIIEAVSPGIVGAIVLVGAEDQEDPHYSVEALGELSDKGITAVVATVDHGGLTDAVGLTNGTPAISLPGIDRESAKSAVVALLESALQAMEGSAA